MDEQQKSLNEQPTVVQPQWQYQSGQLQQQGNFEPTNQSIPKESVVSQAEEPTISWSASEFISHEKNGGWYLLLAIGAIVLGAVLFFVTKEIFSVIVVVVLAIALGVFGALKPRTLDYAIYPDGIQIGDKHFAFEMFRCFAVIEDAPVPSLQLLPVKRFMVPITIYFAPPDAEKIIETLGDFLPVEQKKRDMVDKLSSRIRF